MLKSVKVKVLVSLVLVVMVAMVVGNVVSLATEPTLTINTGNSVGVQITTGNTNTENKASNTNTKGTSISATVGATNNAAKNTNVNANTNKTTNTNKATNTNKTAKLPYAGTNSSVVVVVIALAASAIYAYKKVSDYNI